MVMFDINRASSRKIDCFIERHLVGQKVGSGSAFGGHFRRYSRDWTASYFMETEIRKLGLEREYAAALCELLEPSDGFKSVAFALAHASPEIRARAAAMAIQEALKKGKKLPSGR